ncbi:ribonuclease H-like domain-containing protein [Tanacetum coccineum]
MAIMIGSLDQGNPLHLHPKDSNCASIVSLKLTGVDNYRIWASFMKLALQIKHKMGFINGTCDRFDYLASALLLEQWDRCNDVVLNWILSSLFQDVYLGHVFYDNTANVWNELKETYDRVDDSIVFNLLQKINTLKQGGLPVSEYYHKLNSLWREFDILTKLTDCIDDVYQPIRSSILTREILPEVKDDFVIISREDSHRGMPTSSVKTEKPQVSAFVSRTNDNNIKRTNGTNGNWSNNNGSNVNIGNYDRLLCKNYGLKGHTIDRCFEIIAYPPGFKRNPNLKPSENFNNNKTNLIDTKGNNDVKTCVGTISWTNEQGFVICLGVYRSSRESKSACREVGGVEKISSTGSKLMDRGEECLEVDKHLEMVEEAFDNRLEVIELVLPVLPVPFAEENRLRIRREPATAEAAENKI